VAYAVGGELARCIAARDSGFVAQGIDDVIIHPDVTKDYAARLCKAGSKVQMLSMPNIGHGRAAEASTQAMLDWASDRFAGKDAPNDCSR